MRKKKHPTEGRGGGQAVTLEDSVISFESLGTGGLQAKPQFALLAQKMSQYAKHPAVPHKDPGFGLFLVVCLFVSET